MCALISSTVGGCPPGARWSRAQRSCSPTGVSGISAAGSALAVLVGLLVSLLSPSLPHAATAGVRVRATRDAASGLRRRVVVLGMSSCPFTCRCDRLAPGPAAVLRAPEQLGLGRDIRQRAWATTNMRSGSSGSTAMCGSERVLVEWPTEHDRERALLRWPLRGDGCSTDGWVVDGWGVDGSGVDGCVVAGSGADGGVVVGSAESSSFPLHAVSSPISVTRSGPAGRTAARRRLSGTATARWA